MGERPPPKAPSEGDHSARPGYTQDKSRIVGRLRRIEGQVRGIQKMVEEDRYCIEVLTQVAAIRAALEGVSLTLLEDHIEHCVAGAQAGEDAQAKIRELSAAIGRFVRA